MKPHGKPKLYENPETSQYNRNFTKNRKPHEKPETPRKTRNFTKTPKLHSITETSRKTGNPTKNPKLYGKHKLHGKPKTLHDSRSLRKT